MMVKDAGLFRPQFLVVTVYVYIDIYHGFSNLHNLCLTWPPFVATEATFCWLNLHSWWSIPFLPVVSPCFFWWPKTRLQWLEGLQFRLRPLLGSDDDLGGHPPASQGDPKIRGKAAHRSKGCKVQQKSWWDWKWWCSPHQTNHFSISLQPLQHVAAVVIRPCFSIIYHVPQWFMMFPRFHLGPSLSIIFIIVQKWGFQTKPVRTANERKGRKE